MSNQSQCQSGQHKPNKEQNVYFKKGDVVWAKVRGYSWWPAKIGEVQRLNDRERKYKVDFIGDNTHQTLPQDKVADFIENYSKYSITKKKDLQESIETARKFLKKDDQLQLEKKIAEFGKEPRQMEKGGINGKEDVKKNEKMGDGTGKGSISAKQINASTSESNNDMTATPSKGSPIGQQAIPLNKNSSKKQSENEKIQSKDVQSVSKRVQKQVLKEAEKDKKAKQICESEAKIQADDSYDPNNNGDINPIILDDSIDGDNEESQIICTKTQKKSNASKLKRGKKTLKLHKKVLTEEKEGQDEVNNKKKCKKSIVEQELIEITEDQFMKDTSKLMQLQLSEQNTKEESKAQNVMMRTIDDHEEDSTHKDMTDPLDKTRSLETKKERKSKVQANQFIGNLTKHGKNQSYTKTAQSIDLFDHGEKPTTPQTKAGSTTPKQKESVPKLVQNKGSSFKNGTSHMKNISTGSESNRQSPIVHNNSSSQHQKTQPHNNLKSKQSSNPQIQNLKQISKIIKNMVKSQQQEEEEIRPHYEQSDKQVTIFEFKQDSFQSFHNQLSQLHPYLMQLFKIEMSMELLFESRIGQTIKFLLDFSELYKDDCKELQKINFLSGQIYTKWKNLVNNVFFDGMKNNKDSFQKIKYNNSSKSYNKKIQNIKQQNSSAQSQKHLQQENNKIIPDFSIQRQGSVNRFNTGNLLSDALKQQEEQTDQSRSRQNSSSYLIRTTSGNINGEESYQGSNEPVQ